METQSQLDSTAAGCNPLAGRVLAEHAYSLSGSIGGFPVPFGGLK